MAPNGCLEEIKKIWISAGSDDPVWSDIVKKISDASDRKLSVMDLAAELGLQKGVTGYAYHTVPVALFAWLTHYGDFRKGLEAVLNCGGDTDTVGAIAGALLAINSSIPVEWSSRICDYPISLTYLERMAVSLETHVRPPAFMWAILPLRNLAFLGVILIQVVRRLFPW